MKKLIARLLGITTAPASESVAYNPADADYGATWGMAVLGNNVYVTITGSPGGRYAGRMWYHGSLTPVEARKLAENFSLYADFAANGTVAESTTPDLATATEDEALRNMLFAISNEAVTAIPPHWRSVARYLLGEKS